MRKHGKKQLAILLSAALVMQGQTVYGANLEKTGETIQEAASEITADEGEDAVPGDDEADDFKDENEKDEQENGDEGSDLENGSDQDEKKELNEEENLGEKDGEEPLEGEKDQENGEEPGKNEDQTKNSSDDKDDLEGENQETGESSEDPEDEEKNPEEGVEEDTPEDGQEKELENETELAEDDSLKNEDQKELVPEIPEVVAEEKEQKEKEEKILSWKWKDEQESLIEGELRLSVTEEDHIAFEEIEAMLPAEVTASVSVEDDEEESEKDTEDIEDAEDTAKTEKTKETDIPVLGWTCEDYVQDENGKWPASGEFIFTAELPEEYVLADGVSALEVKVVLEVPGVALLTEELSAITIQRDGKSDEIALTNNKYDGNGYTIEKLTESVYTLTLDGFTGSNITIFQGTWTINVNNTNTINNSSGPALNLETGVKVTITGSGTLDLTGSTYGILVGQNASLSVDNEAINVTGNNIRRSRAAGIVIDRDATMTVNGGKIVAEGRSEGSTGNGIDIYEGGQLNINGGSVTASATNASLSLSGTAKIASGTLDASYILFDSTTGRNSLEVTGSGQVISSKITVCGSNAELEVNGTDAKLTCNDELYIGEETPTVTVNAGTLTAKDINNKGKFVLQGGKLVLNGTYKKEKSGTFEYKNGSITGSGSFAEGSKIPVTITRRSSNDPVISVPNKVDVSNYFTISPSDTAGAVTYSVITDGIAENERGAGTLSGENGSILIVTKVGKIKIKAEVAATEIFASAEAEIQISVVKGTIIDGSVVIPYYNVVYDGKSHDAVNVRLDLIENIENAEVWYAEYDGITTPPDSAYSQTVPTVKNVSDSGKEYYVWIKSSNYEDYKSSSGPVKITPTDQWKVNIPKGTYNGKEQTPKLDVYYYDYSNQTRGETMVEGIDYTVSYHSSGPMLNAGTYYLTVHGEGNYKWEWQGGAFTIDKYNLSGATVTVKAGPFYNGTPQTLTKDQIEVKAGDLTVSTDDYEISFGTDIEVGNETTVTITAKNSSINFTGSKTASFPIKPASLTITGAVLEPKTYDKTTQATVKSVQFAGLMGSQEFSSDDYTAAAQFVDANAGTEKEVQLTVSLKETEVTKNYELTETTFTLTGQTIQKAPALALPDVKLSYSYDRTGEGTVNIHSILPEDAGELTALTAAVTADDIAALDTQVSTDPQTGLVLFRLLENKMENIGKTAEITISGIQTTNYEDMTAKIMITLGEKEIPDTPVVDPTPTVPDTPNTSNGSGGSGSSHTSSDGSSDSSFNSSSGLSWEKTENNGQSPSQTWKLRYADGTYAAGTMETAEDGTVYEQPHWEMVNGKWYAFGADQYAKDGWVYDRSYGTWFYIDIDRGMYTGWVFINGKWYYFHPISDGRKGAMYKEQQTPDGYYVDENGAWDGKER